MGIGLTLKADVLVRSVTVQIQQHTQQPFRNVKNIKRQNQQFALLAQMDALMVDENLIGLQGILLQDDERPKGKAYIIFIEDMFKNEYHLKCIKAFLQI